MCRRVGSSLPRSIVACCVLAPLFVSLCGCGGSTTEGGKPRTGWSEEQQVADGLLSALHDPETFEFMFVEGKAPESGAELFAKYRFHAGSGDVVVDGFKATVTVQVQDSDGDPVGETVQWKAIKKGGEWKLESAPLPAAAK